MSEAQGEDEGQDRDLPEDKPGMCCIFAVKSTYGRQPQVELPPGTARRKKKSDAQWRGTPELFAVDDYTMVRGRFDTSDCDDTERGFFF